MYQTNVVQIDCIDAEKNAVPHGECTHHVYQIRIAYKQSKRHDSTWECGVQTTLPVGTLFDDVQAAVRVARDACIVGLSPQQGDFGDV